MNCKFMQKNTLVYRKILFSIIIILLSLFIPILKKYIYEREYFNNLGIIRLFYLAYSDSNCSILLFVAPILCSIPYATSYLYEKEEIDFNQKIENIGFKKYFIKKILVNSIIGGTVLVEGICIFICIMYFSHKINLNDIKYLYSISCGIDNKNIFLILQLLITFLFGILCANISLCFSIFIPNKKLTILFPFYIYIILSVLNINSNFNLQALYSLDIDLSMSIEYRFGYLLMLNLITCSIYMIGIYLTQNNSIDYDKCKNYYSIAIYLIVLIIIIFKSLEQIYLYNYFSYIFTSSDIIKNILTDKNTLFILMTYIFLNRLILLEKKFKNIKCMIWETLSFIIIVLLICILLNYLIECGSNALFILIGDIYYLIEKISLLITDFYGYLYECLYDYMNVIFILINTVFIFLLLFIINFFYTTLISINQKYSEEILVLFIIFLTINFLPDFINPLSLNYNSFTKYSIKITIGKSFICWLCIICIIFFINYIYKKYEVKKVK